MASAAARSDSSTSLSLLRRVREQDPDAWRALVDLYGPLVFYWGRRSGLSPADAADVLQDVFAAVHGAIARFERDCQTGTFRGWLWTIARNKIRDHFRKRADDPHAAGYLSLVVFVDGRNHGGCQRRGILAVTNPGSRVVGLCGSFYRTANEDPALAENIVIHEALHTLGLEENPPSSQEINKRVFERCGRSQQRNLASAR